MLLQLNKRIHPNLIKHVAEIILDAEKEYTIVSDLGETSFSNNGFVELSNFLDNHNYSKNKEVLFNKVREYIMTNDNYEYMKDYVFITKMRNILKSKIKGKCSQDDFTKILTRFSEFVKKQGSRKYTLDTGNFAGFTVSAFQIYILHDSDFIYEIINERGTLITSGDEDLLATDLLVVEEKKKSSTFDFRDCVKKIVEASRELFPINAKTKESLYFDIVSDYKIYKINKSLDGLSKKIKEVYCPNTISKNTNKFLSNNKYFTSIIVTTPSDINTEYRENTYKLRSRMLSLLYTYLGKSVSYEMIEYIFKDVLTIDFKSLNEKNTSTLLKYPSDFNFAKDYDDMEFNPLENDYNQNLVMKLVMAIPALQSLINYCDDNHIDLFSLPYDIFRTDMYYKRFNTLEDCLLCFDETSRLIKNAGIVQDRVLNNDATYISIANRSEFNFISLKQLIDSLEEKDYNKQILSSMYNKLYNDYVHFSNNLKTFKDVVNEKYGDLEVASVDGIEDDEFLPYLASLMPGDKFSEILATSIELEYVISAYRYVNLRLCVVARLLLILNSVIYLDGLEMLRAISNGDMNPLPESIKDNDDIVALDPNIDLYTGESLKIERTFFQTISYFYQLLQDEFSEEIRLCHKKINEVLKKFSKDGIETKVLISLDETLIQISLNIYDTCEKVQLASFNSFRSLCTVKQGYLYYKGNPYLYKGYYIHEYGYLIHPSGFKIRSVEESDVFL